MCVKQLHVLGIHGIGSNLRLVLGWAQDNKSTTLVVPQEGPLYGYTELEQSAVCDLKELGIQNPNISTIDNLLQCERRVQVEAPPLVEINHRADRDGQFEWISLYNHSGQRGAALHAPVPISSIQVRFIPSKPVHAVHSLRAGRELVFAAQGNHVVVELPPLDQYDIVVFEYEGSAKR